MAYVKEDELLQAILKDAMKDVFTDKEEVVEEPVIQKEESVLDNISDLSLNELNLLISQTSMRNGTYMVTHNYERNPLYEMELQVLKDRRDYIMERGKERC